MLRCLVCGCVGCVVTVVEFGDSGGNGGDGGDGDNGSGGNEIFRTDCENRLANACHSLSSQRRRVHPVSGSHVDSITHCLSFIFHCPSAFKHDVGPRFASFVGLTINIAALFSSQQLRRRTKATRKSLKSTATPRRHRRHHA